MSIPRDGNPPRPAGHLRPLAYAARVAVPLRRSLLAWFRRNARDLPWRRTNDPYRIWLSEVLLQQTRVQTAVPYYHRLLHAFPTVHDLAAADEDRLLKLWEGLGYYRRARHLHQAARSLVREYGGRFPRTAEEWARLPGVGRYTAGAVASIAFGQRVPVLDGNVKRVLARLLEIKDCIDRPRTERLLWSAAEALLAPRSAGRFNQAMMELGARLCTVRGPRCDVCPAAKYCRARVTGRQRVLPVRAKARPVPHYEVVAAAIRRNGRYLLGKRPADGMLAGLWELPGGKVQPSETHGEALVRELQEELGISAVVGERLASVRHAYSHFRITLHVYRCERVRGRIRPLHYPETRWVRPAEFERYAFPTATRKILHLLA